MDFNKEVNEIWNNQDVEQALCAPFANSIRNDEELNKITRINPRHLQFVVRNDEELNKPPCQLAVRNDMELNKKNSLKIHLNRKCLKIFFLGVVAFSTFCQLIFWLIVWRK